METILIADSQEIVRHGIRMILESCPRKYDIIEASRCEEVMEILAGGRVKHAILDMQLADGNIFLTFNGIYDHVPGTKIFVYTIHPERIYAKGLLQKGIRGFLSKNASLAELNNAIRSFLQGEIYLSASLKELLFTPASTDTGKNPMEALTRREMEVIECLMAGISVNDIHVKLGIDITTVSTYRKRAFVKLEVNNIVELVEKFYLYKT